MPRVLRMPSTMELPEGPQRKFVKKLFTYYRAAERPTLRAITDEIAEKFDTFTASRETVRKTLRGETTPVTWAPVDGILTVLCARAGIDPDARHQEEIASHDDWGMTTSRDDSRTHREYLRHLWNEALDNPPPRSRSGYEYWDPDEPPF